MTDMTDTRVDSQGVELSNTDKVFFPDEQLTKGDLIEYYRRVGDVMLPHLEGRPLALHRYPDGISEDGFVQQEAPEYFPDWIDRVTVKKEGGTITHAVCNSRAALVYLANQACITPHPWLSTTDHLRRPDRLIFDLDPPSKAFDSVRVAARDVRELLEELGLRPFVMTTGSRGLHVTCPLVPSAEFDEVREFAREVARLLAARHAETLTAEQRKDKRKGRVFVDYMRNSYAQTAVPPYAVRARSGAPVATPLDWDELGGGDLTSRRYTISNLFSRLGQKTDPWAEIDEHAVSLEAAQRRLSELQEDE